MSAAPCPRSSAVTCRPLPVPLLSSAPPVCVIYRTPIEWDHSRIRDRAGARCAARHRLPLLSPAMLDQERSCFPPRVRYVDQRALLPAFLFRGKRQRSATRMIISARIVLSICAGLSMPTESLLHLKSAGWPNARRGRSGGWACFCFPSSWLCRRSCSRFNRMRSSAV